MGGAMVAGRKTFEVEMRGGRISKSLRKKKSHNSEKSQPLRGRRETPAVGPSLWRKKTYVCNRKRLSEKAGREPWFDQNEKNEIKDRCPALLSKRKHKREDARPGD